MSVAQKPHPSHQQPGAPPARVRVGIILPQDKMTEVRFQPPRSPFTMIEVGQVVDLPSPSPSPGDDVHTNSDSKGRSTTCPTSAGTFTACVDGASIRLMCGGESLGDAVRWCIEPVTEREDSGVTLHDCLAGRGFHWQTHTDEVLPGRIEISIAQSGDSHPTLLVVNDVAVETYLKGVITSEMSGASPIEFLKAQCIVARSWMAAASERKHGGLGIDYCNDDCCQRYQGVGAVTDSARTAVDETAGRVLVHKSGAIVDANYSKSCGGIVEDPRHVWGVAKPGLHSVVDAPPGSDLHDMYPVDDQRITDYATGQWLKNCDAYCGPNIVPEAEISRYLGGVDVGGGLFRWSVEYSAEELENLLRRKHFGGRVTADDCVLSRLHDLVVTRRGASGRATGLDITYEDELGKQRSTTIDDQYEIRRALHDSFLYSSAFDISIERGGDGVLRHITLNGAGWGHGAGLCQIGALGMARNDMDHTRILCHYFKDVTIATPGT